MKLLNHTLLYLSGALLILIGAWATVFYFDMMDEVYDSIDDGLDNYKVLVIQKAHNDSTVLNKISFDESNYRIREISREAANDLDDHYTDTLMFMQNEEDYEPVRILTTVFSMPGNRHYELQIVTSMVEEDDLLESLLYSLLWLYGAILLSVLLINNLLLKRIWKPFYATISQLKQFSLTSNTSFVPPETNVFEFRSMNEALLTLLNRNTEMYNSQKQFIENASHELQTPLAISMNKLELMLGETEFTEAQLQTLSEVVQNLERLKRLNRSLLLLSRIENRQFIQEEQVDLNALIREKIRDFSDMAEFKKIGITLKEEGDFNPGMNPDLAGIIIDNLIKNAIVHNIIKGSITIHIDAGGFRISNTGESGALDESRIFDRFYKVSVQKGSTGLGLAIVKAIVEIYHLKVSYRYDGEHTISVAR